VVKHIEKQRGQSVGENGDTCKYIGEKNRTCGHSMALKKEFRLKADEFITAVNVINKFSDNCHLKKYQGHDKFFWVDCQKFHDDGDYFNKRGK
jgi:hypothetical protein